MYPIDSSVAALFEAENVQVLRITGTDKNGRAISITENDVMLNGFNVDRYSCNGERLEIGTAIAAEMDLKLNNENGAFDSIVFEGTELFVEIGVADWTQDEPTVHYIPIGYFTPDEQPRKLTTISMKALDRMVKFDSVAIPLSDAPWTTENGTEIANEALKTIYFQVGISFPTTVANLVDVLCDQCGVTLAESISSLPNADFVLANFPSVQQDITMRNLLQWCAGIMGTNAWIDWNGELRFSWYNNATDYVSTIENRYSSDIYENDITITGVKYTNTQNATIVAGSDDYALDMTGNYLAAAGIAEILPNVRDAVYGFSYRAFEASVISAPWLWPMDVIAFVDKEGNDHTCVLTNVAFGLNGATALAGEGETQQSNKSKKPSGVTKEQSFLIESATQVAKELDKSLDQEGIFNRLTDNGEIQGLLLYNGKVYLNASYIRSGIVSAEYIDGEHLHVNAANVDGTITASQINSTGLHVSAANIDGTLIIGQLPSTVAEISDIPTKVSELTNDSGFQNSSQVTTITNNTISTTNVTAQNLHVKAANVNDTFTANKIVGGTLTLGGNNNVNGVLQILNGNGSYIGGWGKDGISVNDGSIRISIGSSSSNDYILLNSSNPFYFHANSASSIAEVETRFNQYGYFTINRVYDQKQTDLRPGELYLNGVTDSDGVLSVRGASEFVQIRSKSIGFYENYTSRNYWDLNSFHVNVPAIFNDSLSVSGTKNRVVSTGQYSDRLLYCYETPSPMFGDVGEGVIGEDGKCYVWLDAVFAQTITTSQYQVFLQKYGCGDCWVSERRGSCFVVEGTPGLSFGWEIKAKQADFDQRRLDTPMGEYERDETNYGEQALQYLNRLKERRLSE